jgi:hypothetical protein
MNSRNSVISSIGFFVIGLTLWTTALRSVGWTSTDFDMVFGGLILAAGIVLLVLAILSLQSGEHAFDGLVFFAFAVLALVFSLPNYSHETDSMMNAPVLVGWFYLLWALFWFYLWIGTLKSHPLMHMLFLLLGWLSMFAIAIFEYSGARGFLTLGGYLQLIWALIALYLSAGSALHALCGKGCLPMGAKKASG